MPTSAENQWGGPGLIEKAFGDRSLARIAADRTDELRHLLLRDGALLFRGFNVFSAGEFEEIVHCFSRKPPLAYRGGASPRVRLGKNDVYTSTEYPASIQLPLHNELSYTSTFPDHLYFCCLTEPATGGETTLGDSRRILTRIESRIRDQFKIRQVRYERCLDSNIGSGYSWQDSFESEDRVEVEKRCKEAECGFEWTDYGLSLSEVRPATTIHPETGDEVWFNQADGFHISTATGDGCRSLTATPPRLHSSFGDGTPICVLILASVRKAIEQETIKHKWRRGDMLILDNRLTAHGRMPFRGQRQIAVAMT